MKNNTITRKVVGVFFAIIASLCFCGFALTTANAAETEKITITVEAGDYNAHDLPNGVEGKTYPLFDCSAKTESGKVVESTEVFVQDPDGTYVKVEDGRFATDKVGKYTITYVATYGETYETFVSTVDVKASSEYVAPQYDFGDGTASEGVTGSKIYVADGTVSGGFGNVETILSVEYTGEYKDVTAEISDFGIGKFFVPKASGTYVLKCALSDIIGEATPSAKTITVTDSASPIMDEPSFALMGHKDQKMTFPAVNSRLYRNGKIVYMPVKVYFDGKDITADMSVVPDKTGEFTVKYESANVYDSLAATCVKEYKVTVCDTKPAKAADKKPYAWYYTYTEGFTAAYRTGHETLENRVYVLTADRSETFATMQFKTPVYTQFLKVKVSPETTMHNFETLNVSFVDSLDGNQRVDLSFKSNAQDTVDAYINGVYSATLDLSFTGAESKKSTLELSFEKSDNSIYEATTKQSVGVIKTYANGDKFEGFFSDRAYISVDYEGITGECQLKVYEIAGQKLTSQVADNSQPLMVTGGYTDSSIVEYGSTIIIPDFTVFDLYDEEGSLSLNITAPSGNPVEAKKVAGGYEITLNEYGKYNVNFVAKDSSGNTNTRKTVIYVYDRTAPSIVAPKLPSSVKVGEKLTLSAATVTDNSTKAEDLIVWIYVTDPEFSSEQVENNEYTFEKAGKYSVKYCAEDEDGNITVVEYTIICEG